MHGQETLEDYDSCGIFGESEENLVNSRARIGDNYECLSDCEWQVNLFYKSGDLYFTKWEEEFERFPLVHTSPRIPKDLICLEDCFSFYKNPKSRTLKRKLEKRIAQCSTHGLDTMGVQYQPCNAL